MAYIAFDLDNTLGYFEIVGPLAFFMSPEFLKNPEETVSNELTISKRLVAKLDHVRREFAKELLKRDDLLHAVLRPNLDSMIKPLLRKKPTVIIYSNTGNTFSTHLARDLIEQKYKSPGLFKLIADVFHPLRKPETTGAKGADGYLDPKKTYPVLANLLMHAAKIHTPIHPDQVLFVDDKTPMHPIANATVYGLTYIKPTPYVPKISKKVRQEILQLALAAMDRSGLLSDQEYLASGFCFRTVRRAKGVTTFRGFPDVLSYVWKTMNESYYPPGVWNDDTFTIEIEMRRFFSQLRR